MLLSFPEAGDSKLELLSKRLQQVKGAAESAAQQADAALRLSTKHDPSSPQVRPATELTQLAKKYIGTRMEMCSGPDRTSAMTEIASKMMRVASQVEHYDTRHALRSDDAGERLSAYLYVYVNPDSRSVSDLVETLTTREETGLGNTGLCKQ
jgi:hypothetical protein